MSGPDAISSENKMTYINAVKYLNAHAGGNPSPERMRLLCSYLGSPQKKLRCVHIVGARGKTSVALMLSAVLKEAGQPVGAFVNSYVFEHRERILLNNEPLSHEEFAEYIRLVSVATEKMKLDIATASRGEASDEAAIAPKITKNLLEGTIAPEPTDEEILCAAALLAFSEHASLSLLECGESRADPTGVIDTPLVSLVCGTALDENQLRTACGTIRRGTGHVVCNISVYGALFGAITKADSQVALAERDKLTVRELGLAGKTFEYRGKTYSVPISADFHIPNILLTIDTIYALRRLGSLKLPSADVARGIAAARVPLRFEFVSFSPAIVFDSAEGPADIAALADSLSKLRPMLGHRIRTVIAEDFDESLIEGKFSELGFEELAPVKLGQKGVFKRLSAVISELTTDDVLLVIGSPRFTGSTKKELKLALSYR